MENKKKIAVLGCGSMGTAMILSLLKANHEVIGYSIEDDVIEEIRTKKTNSKYLPDIKLPENFIVSKNLDKVIEQSYYILFAVPSQQVRSVARQIKPFFQSEMIVVNVAKGLEKNSRLRLSEVCKQELGNKIHYGCLTGPSHAEEISLGMPTTVIVASNNNEIAKKIQSDFTTPHFRVYITSDLIGAELGGALKNPLAICAGIIEGIGFGDNTKAALIIRGMEEITRLAVKLGAKEKTIKGLAGTGDAIVTCMSKHSRNHRAGKLIGLGLSVPAALKKVGMVVEGYINCPIICQLAQEKKVEIPIIEKALEVLYQNKTPQKAIRQLMMRDLKEE